MLERLGEVQMIIRRASDENGERFEAVGVNCAAVGVGKTKVAAFQDFVQCIAAMVVASIKNGATIFFEPKSDDVESFKAVQKKGVHEDKVGYGLLSVSVEMRKRKSRKAEAPLIEAEQLVLV